MIEWLNSLFPGLDIPVDALEEELRARLLDGALLCGILKRFNPDYSGEVQTSTSLTFDRNVGFSFGLSVNYGCRSGRRTVQKT